MAVASPTRAFGASIRRREDPRLITGRGKFTDDIHLASAATAMFVRSPHGHARIVSIDTSAAAAHPGVLGVYTYQDVKAFISGMPCAWPTTNTGDTLKLATYPPLADGKVRFFGEAVALVVAVDPNTAADAVDLVQVEYDPLPAVVNNEAAVAPGAPLIHDSAPGNQAFRWSLVGGDTNGALEHADVRISQTLVNQRLIATPMETRCAVADYNPASGEVTVWVTSQNPHIHRLLIALSTGIPEHKIRVIAGDVGGGFGAKIPYYAGEALCIFASKELGVPVRWSESRSENYVATAHGRDHIQHIEVGATKEGKITALKVTAYASLGAYPSTAAPGVPTWLFGCIIQGPYDIPNNEVHVIGVYTNTTPTDAYRGAGRPEATYILERVIDLVAAKVGRDPVDVRRLNFVKKDQFPFKVANGTLTYDSGDYELALDQALHTVDYTHLRAWQEEQRAAGKLVGIGFSSFVEVCGLGPSSAANAMGFAGGLYDSATIRVHPTGKVTVFTGVHSHGQGHETSFAQIVARDLGVKVDDVDVIHGDTDKVQHGMGTYGSRSAPVGGGALRLAGMKIRAKAQKIAAHLLEVAEEDIEWVDDAFRVKGSPDKSKTIPDCAFAAYMAGNLPAGVTPILEEQHWYDPENFVYPFGTHICVVEVDRETGETHIKRYVAVDDCGEIINPMLRDGQVHGGIAQGIAQALWEEAVYDENGQLLSGSLMDYAIPKASVMPHLELGHTVTPSPHNPLGVKGIGEAGTIASTPAVVNAVMDALSPLGIHHIDMPLRPAKVWAAIDAASH